MKFAIEFALISQIASLIMLALMSYYLIKSWLIRKSNKDQISESLFTLTDLKEVYLLNHLF